MKSKLLYGVAALILLTFAVHPPKVVAMEEDSNIEWRGNIKADKDLLKARMAEIAKIGLGDALSAALAKQPGKAIKAELESEDGYLIYGVEIVTADGKVKEFILDPADGKPTKQRTRKRIDLTMCSAPSESRGGVRPDLFQRTRRVHFEQAHRTICRGH
jgi:hypothetical protein